MPRMVERQWWVPIGESGVVHTAGIGVPPTLETQTRRVGDRSLLPLPPSSSSSSSSLLSITLILILIYTQPQEWEGGLTESLRESYWELRRRGVVCVVLCTPARRAALVEVCGVVWRQ